MCKIEIELQYAEDSGLSQKDKDNQRTIVASHFKAAIRGLEGEIKRRVAEGMKRAAESCLQWDINLDGQHEVYIG